MGAVTNQVRDLYRTTGVGKSNTGLLLTRYVNLCIADKSFKELAELASETDLPQAIHDRIGEVPDAGVRAAWVANAARTLDELEAAFDRENRKKVQLAFAHRTDLWDAAYIELASSRFAEVSEAVLTNTSAPAAAYCAAIRATSPRIPITTVRLRELAETHDEVLDALVKDPRSMRVAEVILEVYDDENVIVELLDRLDKTFRNTAATLAAKQKPSVSYQHSRRLDECITTLGGLSLNGAVPEKLRQRGAELLSEWNSISNQPSQSTNAQRVMKRFTAPAPVRTARGRTKQLELARTSDNLTSMIALATEHRDTDLMAALLANPNCPESAMRSWTTSHIRADLTKTVPLLRDNWERLIEVMSIFVRDVNDDALEATGDAKAAVNGIVSRITERGYPMLDLQRRLGQWTATDADILLKVPLEMLLKVTLQTELKEQLGARLEAALGSNPERYEMFESLAGEMSVPLGEVLHTCQLMVPDADGPSDHDADQPAASDAGTPATDEPDAETPDRASGDGEPVEGTDGCDSAADLEPDGSDQDRQATSSSDEIASGDRNESAVMTEVVESAAGMSWTQLAMAV